MRLVRVAFLAAAAAGLWILLVFVPVFIAVFLALRWPASAHNRLFEAVEQANGSIAPCPPIHPAAADATESSRPSPPSAFVTIRVLKENPTEVRILHQCGEWIRIQDAPEQWLHPASRTLLTVTDEPSSSKKPKSKH